VALCKSVNVNCANNLEPLGILVFIDKDMLTEVISIAWCWYLL